MKHLKSNILVVFPGGGSPDYDSHKEVYQLIEKEAQNYGYKEVDISLRWPGHVSKKEGSAEVLTFDGCMNNALKKLEELEKRGERYSLLGRCFGANVACNCALTSNLKCLGKIILWGSVPYWLWWELFKRDLDKTVVTTINKGLRTDKSLFPTIIPLETLLPRLNCPVIVAAGTEDNLSPPSYLKYLELLVSGKINFEFRRVEGAGHKITEKSPEWRKYIRELFR